MVALREEFNNEVKEFKSLLEDYENRIKELEDYQKQLEEFILVPFLRTAAIDKIISRLNNVTDINEKIIQVLYNMQNPKYLGIYNGDDIKVINVLGYKYKLLSESNYAVSESLLGICKTAI